MRALPTRPTFVASNWISPPISSAPFASITPCASSVPVSPRTVTVPPLAPLASSRLVASSVTSFTARKTILPPSPISARLAETMPEFLISVP